MPVMLNVSPLPTTESRLVTNAAPAEPGFSPNLWFEWIGDPSMRPEGMYATGRVGIQRQMQYAYCFLCHNRVSELEWVRCPTEGAVMCGNHSDTHNHSGPYCGDCGYNVSSSEEVSHCDDCDIPYCHARHGSYHTHDEYDSEYDDRYDDRPPVRYWGREASMEFIDQPYVEHPLALGERAATAEIEVEWNPDSGVRESLNLGAKVGTHFDGSLDNGIEVTLPPSRGKQLVAFMTSVCERLQAGGYHVAETCGMHIHIDLRDKIEDKPFMSHLFNAFFATEDIFYAMQKVDRQHSEYTIPLRRNYKFYEMYGQDVDSFDYNFYKQDKTENGKRIMDSEKTRKYGSPRYAAFNFHSVYFRGSLEVRIHEGNVDAVEALNWIDLFQFIIKRVERSHSYKYMDMLVRSDVTPDKVKKFFRYFQIPRHLRKWVLARIEAGQGFGYNLGRFSWGTPKKGRARQVVSDRPLHVNRHVQCGRCDAQFVMRRRYRRCPNCNRTLFDIYGNAVYHLALPQTLDWPASLSGVFSSSNTFADNTFVSNAYPEDSEF